VAKLVVAKEDVLSVSRALELALFYDAKLDVSKSQPSPARGELHKNVRTQDSAGTS
jgi:hypothetical protein